MGRRQSESPGKRGKQQAAVTRPTAQHTESASEDKFRLLFERTADALLLLDATSGVFVDCNAAAVAMLRCSNRQELLSLHPAEISPPHQPDGRPSREKADEMIAIAMRQGSHRFEWVHCAGPGVEPCGPRGAAPVTADARH